MALMAVTPTQVEIVNAPSPAFWEWVLDVATAAGTVGAVVVSLLLAWRATKERKQEAQARAVAEATLKREQKAFRQAQDIDWSIDWFPQQDGLIAAPDGFGQAQVRIQNESRRDITDVVIHLDPPLLGPDAKTPLSHRVPVIPRGADHPIDLTAYVGPNPHVLTTMVLEFTDYTGDRWQRQSDHGLALIDVGEVKVSTPRT